MTTETIAKLNDAFRKAGKFYAAGSLAQELREKPRQMFAIAKLVQEYSNFTEDNDPYKERDMGSFTHEGKLLYWKIDYYDIDLRWHSPDPADPEVTCRVLTVCYMSDY